MTERRPDVRALAANLSSASRRYWQRAQATIEAWSARQRGPGSGSGSEASMIAGLGAEQPSTRWLSAAALARNSQRSPEAIAALFEALADPEEFVRWQAADALASQEPGNVYPALSELLESANPLQRQGAATALGRLGGEASALALNRRLSEPDPAVRAAIVEALGEGGDPTVAETLLPLLADDDPDVRRAAAGALGRLGNPVATVGLAEALSAPDQPLLVRRAAAAALARTPHPDAEPALLMALKDPDPQVRAYASRALGQAGADTAVAALQALKADRTPVLRGSVGDAAQEALTMLERRGRAARTGEGGR